MSDPSENKARLREALRRQRRALSDAEQQAAAEAAVDHVGTLPHWQQAERVALYLSADSELDTGPLSALSRTQGKSLYLPVIREDDSLEFALWASDESLVVNRYGIPEPPPAAARHSANELDIIFLPLVGWDEFGNRLGMGGGFYDRTLAGVRQPLLVGLAHDCQRAERVPREAWDISMDFVATGSTLVRCQGASPEDR
jgi:5-formyltetrahydrofolate cyclo-ligase